MKGKTVRILIGVFIFTLIAGVAGAQILPQAQTQTLLPALSIPQFVEPLPVAGDIAVVDATGGGTHDIGVFEFKAQVLPRPANWPAGAPAGCTAGTWSWTWGYRSAADYDGPAIPDYRPLNAGAVRESYLGPVVVALRGTPASFNYFNFLPDTAQQPMGVTDPSHVLANLPIDLTLDWALKTVVDCAPDPLTGDYTNGDCANWPPWGYSSPFMNEQVPIATHLHGGEVPPAFDGGPDAWITQNGTRDCNTTTTTISRSQRSGSMTTGWVSHGSTSTQVWRASTLSWTLPIRRKQRCLRSRNTTYR